MDSETIYFNDPGDETRYDDEAEGEGDDEPDDEDDEDASSNLPLARQTPHQPIAAF